MRHHVPTRTPFSLGQSLAFIERFPPNRDEFVIERDSITAALAIGDRAVPFTVRASSEPIRRGQRRRETRSERTAAGSSIGAMASELEVEAPDDVPASEIVPRIVAWLGADHDLTAFYDAAEKDPPFREIVRRLYGLHHVAFVSLAEIAVYCVMMQRAPITMAARMKARFLDRYGVRVNVPGLAREERAMPARELRAMPELDVLATLDGDEIGEAIRHRIKGPKIATVVRGVAAIGEDFLRTAPYEKAREALLEIPGVGPFSAGAILLRGLGRMDALPMGVADEEAKTLYGRSFDRSTIEKRYGAHIGYWSFYLKTGVARRSQ